VPAALDDDWPTTDFDLIVLSELGYYLQACTLWAILDRELPRLTGPATVIAAHWRHAVTDYPMTADRTNEVTAATPGLHRIGAYDTSTPTSVAARTGVPGS
jgi:hypothetical protein